MRASTTATAPPAPSQQQQRHACATRTVPRHQRADAMRAATTAAGTMQQQQQQQQQRHACTVPPALQQRASAAAAAAALAAMLVTQQAGASTAEPVAADRSLAPCSPGSACVSTSSFMQPAQHLSPWLFRPQSPQSALRSLLDELAARSAVAVEVDEAAGYVQARVPTGGRQDFDELQFLIKPDGLVLFKSQASRAKKPYPPFCFTPGCISGPGNRARLEALRNDLGWTQMETDEDKVWVQILLH